MLQVVRTANNCKKHNTRWANLLNSSTIVHDVELPVKSWLAQFMP